MAFVPARRALKILGFLLVLAFIALLVLNYFDRSRATASERLAPQNLLQSGEEVYASHDCTDCHLPPHVLKAKRDKNEVGLIRVRKDIDILTKFLETDKRHDSYSLMETEDRRALIEFLKANIAASP